MSNGHSFQVRFTWSDPNTGDQQEQTETLPVTIGRQRNNTIIIHHEKVSRSHARLEKKGDRVVIMDLQSAGGVLVKQQRVPEATLKDGAEFQIGPVKFTISIETGTKSTSQGQSWALQWRDPNNNRSHESLIDSSLSIGRDSTNDIVLKGDKVSRKHVDIELKGRELILADGGSANGSIVNGKTVRRATLKEGDQIRIGDHTFTVARVDGGSAATNVTSATNATNATNATPPPDPTIGSNATILAFDDQGTLIFERESEIEGPGLSIAAFNRPTVSIAELQQSGVPVFDTTYLAIGGGLGSFTWVNHLMVFGVNPDQIVSIGLESKPHARYERLCGNSQIPHHERLRSNSDSCPDNIWGWPGYAVREVWYSLKQGDIGNGIKTAWQIFVEPAAGLTYTPKAGDVFRSIDQEANRIGWSNIWRYGRVKAIRKTDDGRYAVAYSQTNQNQGRRQGVILASYVHIAIGYPGVRFLPDLQQYRERHTDGFKQVVNAYEEHDQIYRQLERRGGVVMVRGRGIVSSRVVQRIYEARQKNKNISLLHLMRRPIAEGFSYNRSQRETDNHWEFQPFNWPKACWSGDLRELLEGSSPQERDQLLDQWGGTTTADRPDWRFIVNQGIAEGWYQIRFGNVKKVEERNSKLVTVIEGTGEIKGRTELLADFIIDGTGLESEIDKHPLLKDLINHHQLRRNPKGRLDVGHDFEIEGMRNGNGRIYASGVMTLGGPYAPVDSFLGLQYAALRSVDTLAAIKAPGVRRLNGFRSFFQWLRWVRGVRP